MYNSTFDNGLRHNQSSIYFEQHNIYPVNMCLQWMIETKNKWINEWMNNLCIYLFLKDSKMK